MPIFAPIFENNIQNQNIPDLLNQQSNQDYQNLLYNIKQNSCWQEIFDNFDHSMMIEVEKHAKQINDLVWNVNNCSEIINQELFFQIKKLDPEQQFEFLIDPIKNNFFYLASKNMF